MAVSRRQIAWRWLMVLGVLLGVTGWLLFGLGRPSALQMPSPKDLSPPDLDLPGAGVRKALKRGIRLLTQPPRHNPVVELDLDFLPQGTYRPLGQGAGPLRLGLVFVGQNQRYAVINGRVYSPGQDLADGRRVDSISEAGVLLSKHGQGELIPWRRPGMVFLGTGSGATGSSAPSSEAGSAIGKDESKATSARQESSETSSSRPAP